MADAIVVTLYRNNSDPTVLNKDLKFIRIFRGVFREPFDVLAPVILLEYSAPIDFNYVEIPILKRFYFVNGYRNVSSNLWAVELSVDVLESYKNTVLGLTAIIERNEHTFNNSIIDTMQVYEAGHNISHYFGDYEFSGEMDGDTPRYILNAPFFTVTGGESNNVSSD